MEKNATVISPGFGTNTNLSFGTQQQQKQNQVSNGTEKANVLMLSGQLPSVNSPNLAAHIQPNQQQLTTNNSKRKAIESKSLSSSSSSTRKKQMKSANSIKEGHTQSRLSSGHRPVTSCTHCRQHKIKCNASEKFPSPCSRCDRMSLSCEIDPQFRPKKGSQIQCLKNDVEELRSKIEFLSRNEHLLVQALQQQGGVLPANVTIMGSSPSIDGNSIPKSQTGSPPLVAKTYLKKEPHLLQDSRTLQSLSSAPTPELLNDSLVGGADLPPIFEHHSMRRINSDSSSLFKSNYYAAFSPRNFSNSPTGNTKQSSQNQSPSFRGSPTPNNISEFILGGVKLPMEKAIELHRKFVESYLPFLPIMTTDNPTELYEQSQLLFWVVMLTSCLSDPEPTLYVSLASLIKQLAIETCWIRTPRSTHIIQALLILATWPLPNQKILDDCSYRFLGLAKNLSLQLGLHRGKFISEFSRTQVALPNAEKWRTRTWLAVFLGDQFWASTLGLPPSMNTDYLLENARIDNTLPKNFRCLISLSIFQSKLVNMMGSSVTTPDGLMDLKNRIATLSILERELERLSFKLQIDDLSIEIYYLYVKLMVCCFAFLPETPIEDQVLYVISAYTIATRIVTIISKLIEDRQLIEYPIHVRQSVTTAVLLLFRLHLSPYLLPKYVDSARQSIVTVHRLFRNMLSSWKDVENDISRTATVLENLNFVIITHPELFTKNEGIIVRMRSHLTGSLFYDLVWCIHEARRRVLLNEKSGNNNNTTNTSKEGRPLPLPFYNQISKDDFRAITTTTPNGTTVTTLVPTDRAMDTATANATLNGLSGPVEINGIPLSALDATGSVKRMENEGNILNDNNQINDNNPNNVNTPLGNQPPDQFINNANPTPKSEILGENLTQFLSNNNNNINNNNNNNNTTLSSSSSKSKVNSDQQFIDAIFQQQSANWMEGGDDFLGWFDMNMAPEF